MRNTMRAGLAAVAVLGGLAISTLTGAGPSGAAPHRGATASQARFPFRGLTGGKPGTPASPLAGARMIAPGISRASSPITADGSTVLSVVVARDGQARLDELAPGSGHVRRSFPLAGPARPEARQDCTVLWASPSARKIITQCGQAQHLITG